VLFSKDASLTVPVMLATRATCVEDPYCPAESVDFAHYRFGGKRGFGAILGIGMPTPGAPPNPFAAAGIKSWIVDWPNGKIILNPDDRDLDGFVVHRRIDDGWSGTITGCLAVGSQRICGPTLLDTGTTDIVLFTKGTRNYEELRAARSYFLTLGERGDAQAIQFTAPSHLFQLAGAEDLTSGIAMVAGAPVVKDLAIFFDPQHQVIGVKPAKPMKPDSIEPELQVNAANAIPPLGTLPAPFARPAAAGQ
jgi:hypothetical protein